jgi:hypothetical protein
MRIIFCWSSIVGHLKYLKFNEVLLLIMKIIKEFIGVLLSRGGVLLLGTGVLSSEYCSLVGYF